MKASTKAVILASVFTLGLTVDLGSQCSKTWVRKKCVPKVSPFIHNGQMNTALLKEGQKTESVMTFYSGQDYRILVCSEETLENVSFVVSDMTGKVLFDSKANDNTDFWDFKVKTTTEMRVEVFAGTNDSDDGEMSGCVSILVGFKSK
jgi:hypothetical protein